MCCLPDAYIYGPLHLYVAMNGSSYRVYDHHIISGKWIDFIQMTRYMFALELAEKVSYRFQVASEKLYHLGLLSLLLSRFTHLPRLWNHFRDSFPNYLLEHTRKVNNLQLTFFFFLKGYASYYRGVFMWLLLPVLSSLSMADLIAFSKQIALISRENI